MKKWTTPMAMEECFTANVDVAVTTCYKIGCNTDAATEVEKQIYANNWLGIRPHHINLTCGSPNNQTIQVDSTNGNKVKKMKAVRYSFSGPYDVDCVFYDPGYQAQINAEKVDINNTIYWVTNENGMKYHHQGNLRLGAVASNKSMS